VKILRREYLRNPENDGGRIPEGCLHCGGELTWDRPLPSGVEHPLRCPACGVELAVTLSRRGQAAGVRLPYGCEAWFDVESSNLAAAGKGGGDLLVRFRAGGVYRYPGGGDLLTELVRAESVGKFFHARVRPLGGISLCCCYGCVEPAHREQNQVMCLKHLER